MIVVMVCACSGVALRIGREFARALQHRLRLKWYSPTLVWKHTQMRSQLPMTIQALPGAISPLPNVPFTPSELHAWMVAGSGRMP